MVCVAALAFRRVGKDRSDVLRLQAQKIPEDFLLAHATSKVIEDVRRGNAGADNAGFAAAHAGVIWMYCRHSMVATLGASPWMRQVFRSPARWIGLEPLRSQDFSPVLPTARLKVLRISFIGTVANRIDSSSPAAISKGGQYYKAASRGLSTPDRSMPMFSHHGRHRSRLSFPAIVTVQLLPSAERALMKWMRSRPLKTLIVR